MLNPCVSVRAQGPSAHSPTLNGLPGVRVDAHHHVPAPHHHRALDQAGGCQQLTPGTGAVLDGRLGGRVELAPGGALAVHQRLPTGLVEPDVERGLGHALFFEIMEVMLDLVVLHPGARFFDAVAVRDAIEGDAGGAHARIMHEFGPQPAVWVSGVSLNKTCMSENWRHDLARLADALRSLTPRVH